VAIFKLGGNNYNNNDSVALVHEQTVLTELPQLFGEVSANFCRKRVSCGQHCELHKAGWALFQTHYFSEDLVVPRIESGPLDL
jgi:hypothetical protein